MNALEMDVSKLPRNSNRDKTRTSNIKKPNSYHLISNRVDIINEEAKLKYERQIKTLKNELRSAKIKMKPVLPQKKIKPPAGLLESLLEAIELKKHDIISRILTGDWNLNVLGKGGKGPLHVAAYKGDVFIIRLLIRYGTDLTLCDKYGTIPVDYARLGEVYNEYNIAITEELIFACSKHDIITVDKLLNGNINVNSRNERGLTALHEAATVGDLSLCIKLLNYNADRKIEDLMGEKPWQKAKTKGFDKIAKLLRPNNKFNEKIIDETKSQITNLDIIDIPNFKIKLSNLKNEVINEISEFEPESKAPKSLSSNSPERTPKAYIENLIHIPKTKNDTLFKYYFKDEINDQDVSDNEMKLWAQYLNRTKKRASVSQN